MRDLQGNNVQRAVAIARQYTAESPGNPGAWYLYGSALVAAGQSAREAFRHYENNWAFVRDTPMEPGERKLLERLKREYGDGLING